MRTAIVVLSLVSLLSPTAAEAQCPRTRAALWIEIDGIPAGTPDVTCPFSMDLGSATIVGNSLIITKPLDSDSPQMLLSATRPISRSSAELFVNAGDGTAPKGYSFREVVIASVRQTASPAEETITLNFVELRLPPKTAAAPTGRILGGAKSVPVTFRAVFGAPAPQITSQQVPVNGMSISVARGPKGPVLIVMLQGTAPTMPMREGESYSTVDVTLFGKSGVVGTYVLRGVTVSEAGGQMNLTFDRFAFERQEMSTVKPIRFDWDVKTSTAR
jgi:hypothetical protein